MLSNKEISDLKHVVMTKTVELENKEIEILNLNKRRKILDKPMSLILLAAEKFSDANLKVQNVPAEV